MYVSLLFWLLLLLPGYCLVDRFFRDDVDAGLLGVVSVSYLVALAALSPVSVACYICHLPVWVLSATCLVSVLVSVVDISRRRRWRKCGQILLAGVGIELAIVVLDVVLGAWVGAVTLADARVHLARIRFLLDHGFNNLDPFVAEPYFFPIYHTNLLHALQAVCAQITGVDHLGVWYASLAWAKLLVVSGVYYMVWCVFGIRVSAWSGALFAIGLWGPTTFLIYPNKVGPLWLLPCIIGLAVKTCRQNGGWHEPFKLALGVWLLAQIHCLYAIFALVALAPTLLVSALVFRIRRNRNARRALVCTLALLIAAPFLLVSVSKESAVRESTEPVEAVLAHRDHRLTEVGAGWVMLDPRYTPLGRGWNLLLLSGGLVCAFAGGYRRSATLVIAIMLTVAAIFFVPPLCTAALSVLRKVWILKRLGTIITLCVIAVGVGGIAAFLARYVRSRWWSVAVSLLALGAGVSMASRQGPYSWKSYIDRIRAPWNERGAFLIAQRRARDLLREHVPKGSTVLTDLESGVGLVATYDCHIVVASTSSAGVTDQARRRRDLATLLKPETPWALRRTLLRKYNATHYISYRPDAHRTAWMKGHSDQTWTDGGLVLVSLNLD